MPIVIIIAILSVVIIALFYRRKIAARITQRRGPPTTTRNGASPRELTAEQLAGTINAGVPAPTPRTRRNRRPRRTPSQISTISLPAYAKEPGEQEVVIFR